MRLIDTDELLKSMDTWDKFGYTARYGLERLDKDDKDFVPYVKYDDMVNAVKNAPTIEAVPVIHADWKRGYTMPDGVYYKCSNCNELIKVRYPMLYCCNCGAKMDGGEKPSLQRRGRMTNGENLKNIYPDLEIIREVKDVYVIMLETHNVCSPKLEVFKSWWNAEYKEPSSSEKPNKSEIPTGPNTKKCTTCAYRKIDGKPHEMCKSCVCGNRYKQEPRKGHWIETAEEYYKAINEKGGGVNENTDYFVDDIACSECLAKFSVIDNEAERFDFCPCCGSDNREVEECQESCKDGRGGRMTREELRDYVEEQRNLNNIPYHVYSALIDGIDTLEQEPRWIPVSERLPEKYCYTLWCASSGEIRTDFFNGEYWEDAKKYGYQVVAWMPLPEPYREVEE